MKDPTLEPFSPEYCVDAVRAYCASESERISEVAAEAGRKAGQGAVYDIATLMMADAVFRDVAAFPVYRDILRLIAEEGPTARDRLDAVGMYLRSAVRDYAQHPSQSTSPLERYRCRCRPSVLAETERFYDAMVRKIGKGGGS